MQAQRFNVNIEEDHQIRLNLPSDFPSGPAEVIVLAERNGSGKVLRLGGVLRQESSILGDPIGEALSEMRAERSEQTVWE